MFKRTQAALTRRFSMTIGIILALTVLFALWMVQHMITSSQNSQLLSITKQYASELKGLIDSPKWELLYQEMGNRNKISASFAPSGLQLNQMAWLVSPEGEILLQSSGKDREVIPDFPLMPLLPSLLGKPDNTYDNVNAGDRSFRIGGMAMNGASAGEVYRIIVAQEVTSDVALLAQLRWAFIGFAAAMLILGAAAGYVLAGRAMVPIVQAYRRQEQFTADASHELRTPLSILRSSVEVLNEQREALPAFHRKVLAKTGKEIHHLIRLVDNLLTLARSDNGRIELMKTTFSLRNTVRQVLEQLEPLAQSRGIRVRWSAGSDEVFVFGDEVRIRQLVFILAENAMQYNREGGTVTIDFAARSNETSFIVNDTGIGISKAHLNGIFERFYRLDQARTRRSEGTGLGLAIAKQIVLAHQGKLRVESEEGTGTTFYVTLPIVSESFQNVPLQ
ncbi:sensor histidine kinase [Paenibacillus montanisoli]|nr:ATP-binding protein [Paenibacillus montanisoli]